MEKEREEIFNFDPHGTEAEVSKSSGSDVWPTAEDLRSIAATQPDPRAVVREIRSKVRPASARTLDMRLDGQV